MTSASEPSPPGKPPKIKIQGPGSFGVNRGELEGKLRAHRDSETSGIEQAEKDQEEAAKTQAQEERDRQIDDLLPSRVFSLFGDVAYGIFKEYYKVIWDQVADKTHLARGFCTFNTEVQPDLPVTVRTFRAKEFRQLQYLAPQPGEDAREFLTAQIKFRNARVSVALISFDNDGEPFADLGNLLAEKGLEDWLDDDVVKTRFDWLDEMPEEMLAAISAVISDVTQAYRLAVQENLKNQFAPLSPSTD